MHVLNLPTFSKFPNMAGHKTIQLLVFYFPNLTLQQVIYIPNNKQDALFNIPSEFSHNPPKSLSMADPKIQNFIFNFFNSSLNHVI
jgi:hypothetical protein